jgi:hypothetical protein
MLDLSCELVRYLSQLPADPLYGDLERLGRLWAVHG